MDGNIWKFLVLLRHTHRVALLSRLMIEWKNLMPQKPISVMKTSVSSRSAAAGFEGVAVVVHVVCSSRSPADAVMCNWKGLKSYFTKKCLENCTPKAIRATLCHAKKELLGAAAQPLTTVLHFVAAQVWPTKFSDKNIWKVPNCSIISKTTCFIPSIYSFTRKFAL